MPMRDYEDMKNIVIPKEQEEMMDVICDAWEECRSLETCKECPDRPKKFMRMAMCTALKYTRKLIEAGYAKQPTSDVVQVVRCKDCTVPHNQWTGCPKLNGLVTPPDFYCSYGERKKECKECPES